MSATLPPKTASNGDSDDESGIFSDSDSDSDGDSGDAHGEAPSAAAIAAFAAKARPRHLPPPPRPPPSAPAPAHVPVSKCRANDIFDEDEDDDDEDDDDEDDDDEDDEDDDDDDANNDHRPQANVATAEAVRADAEAAAAAVAADAARYRRATPAEAAAAVAENGGDDDVCYATADDVDRPCDRNGRTVSDDYALFAGAVRWIAAMHCYADIEAFVARAPAKGARQMPLALHRRAREMVRWRAAHAAFKRRNREFVWGILETAVRKPSALAAISGTVAAAVDVIISPTQRILEGAARHGVRAAALTSDAARVCCVTGVKLGPAGSPDPAYTVTITSRPLDGASDDAVVTSVIVCERVAIFLRAWHQLTNILRHIDAHIGDILGPIVDAAPAQDPALYMSAYLDEDPRDWVSVLFSDYSCAREHVAAFTNQPLNWKIRP